MACFFRAEPNVLSSHIALVSFDSLNAFLRIIWVPFEHGTSSNMSTSWNLMSLALKNGMQSKSLKCSSSNNGHHARVEEAKSTNWIYRSGRKWYLCKWVEWMNECLRLYLSIHLSVSVCRNKEISTISLYYCDDISFFRLCRSFVPSTRYSSSKWVLLL